MQEYSDIIIFIVVLVSFFAGYWIVSFLINHFYESKNRQRSDEEMWRHRTDSEERMRNRQDRNTQEKEREGEERGSEWHTEWEEKQRKDKKSSETVKDEKYFEAILGLHPGDTVKDIKRRYRELATQYHPDKVAHLGPKLRKAADQEMTEINEAYNFFKRKYDLL